MSSAAWCAPYSLRSRRYLWGTESVVVGALVGAVGGAMLCAAAVLVFFGGNLEVTGIGAGFLRRLGVGGAAGAIGGGGKRGSHLPFICVFLGWEIEGAVKRPTKHRKVRACAKYATIRALSKPARAQSFLKKYGAIDPATGLPPLPERFLIAEFGDRDKALERWRDTLQWRESEKCDHVLQVRKVQ